MSQVTRSSGGARRSADGQPAERRAESPGRRRENIFLIGFSGTGKSRSGRSVARRLGWRFVDTDQIIERREGMGIPDIFAERGEEHFRRLEREVLKDVAAQSRQVISTGGGMPVSAENRALMGESGLRVRLTASAETIHRRLARSKRPGRDGVVRPLLGARAPLARVRELLAEREAAYAESDVTVDTERNRPTEVIDRIVELWEGDIRNQGRPR